MPRPRIEAVVLDGGGTPTVAELTAAGELGLVPLAIAATFTASATVGSRYVGVEYRDQGDRLLFRTTSSQAITAGEAWAVAAALEAAVLDQTPATTITMRLPELPLEPGWSIRLVTFNPEAGDEFTAAVVVVEYGPPTLREAAADEWAGHGVHLEGPRARHRLAG